MAELKITLEHEGTTYSGYNAVIKDTMLGPEDHGIWTTFLFVEWSGGGVGIGGRGIGGDTPGLAYGMDLIIQTCETVGVRSWEKLKGQRIIALFEGDNPLGQMAAGLASPDGERVLILADHALQWRERVDG